MFGDEYFITRNKNNLKVVYRLYEIDIRMESFLEYQGNKRIDINPVKQTLPSDVHIVGKFSVNCIQIINT